MASHRPIDDLAIIDVDAHISEPYDLWTSRAPASLRDRLPHVVEKDGRASMLGVYGGRSRAADGTVRIRARAWRGNRGPPPAIRVSWHRREERGSLRFRLKDIPLR